MLYHIYIQGMVLMMIFDDGQVLSPYWSSTVCRGSLLGRRLQLPTDLLDLCVQVELVLEQFV